jgi:hypothetical protein
MTLLQSGLAKSLAAAAYTIDQSLRFNIADGPYLERTFGTGNRRAFTISLWFKCSVIATSSFRLFSVPAAGTDGPGSGLLAYNSSGTISFQPSYDNVTAYKLETSAVFRDPSAWYSIVAVWDSDNVTEADRIRLYVNGVRETAFSSTAYPPRYLDCEWMNTAITHYISTYDTDEAFIGGYLAEYYFIDGQALTEASFGETDEDTNQWKPIDASGLTFGTNGFYLKFQDSSDFGDDSSGEGNDFTVTNLVATDQMVDSPTNNFATLNSLDQNGITLAEGNLKGTGLTAPWSEVRNSIGVSSGKWYWEVLYVSESESACWVAGIRSTEGELAQFHWYSASWSTATNGYNYGLLTDGAKVSSGTYTESFTSALSTGDIIGFALDLDSGTTTLDVYVNNSSAGTMYSSLQAGQTWTPGLSLCDPVGASVSVAVMNLGSDSSFAGAKTAQGNQDGNSVGDFYYAPPTDFLALCTSNLDDPEITLPGDNFDVQIWTGTAATKVITTGFQTDFVWGKNRNGTSSHCLMDVIRGTSSTLKTNSNAAVESASDVITSFDSTGYTLGDSATGPNLNQNGSDTFVGWAWKAGGTPTATNVATSGVMTSGSVFINGSSDTSFTPGSTIYPEKISANTTNGFSIVEYDGNVTSGATVAHGLSQAPELYVLHSLDVINSWQVYADPLGSNNRFIQLNEAGAYESNTNRWNDTSPTASLFSLGNGSMVNASGEPFIVYCWHSVEGYSKVCRYEGNGNTDGTFIYTGFRPAFLLAKNVDAGASNWIMEDNKRNPYNPEDTRLWANLNDAETTAGAGYADFDFVSNGVKIRGDSGNYNSSAKTYLCIVFAESPFKYANAR